MSSNSFAPDVQMRSDDAHEAIQRNENAPSIQQVGVTQSQSTLSMPPPATKFTFPGGQIPVFRPSRAPVSYMSPASQDMTPCYTQYTMFQSQTVINPANGQPVIIYQPVVVTQPMMNMNPNFTMGPVQQNIERPVADLPSDDKSNLIDAQPQKHQVEGRRKQRLQIIDPQSGKKVKLPGDISDNEEERNISTSEVSYGRIIITNPVIPSLPLPRKKTMLDIIDPKTGQKVELPEKKSPPRAPVLKIEIVNPATGKIVELPDKSNTQSIQTTSLCDIPFKEVESIIEPKESIKILEDIETETSEEIKPEPQEETVAVEEIITSPVSEEIILPNKEVVSENVSDDSDTIVVSEIIPEVSETKKLEEFIDTSVIDGNHAEEVTEEIECSSCEEENFDGRKFYERGLLLHIRSNMKFVKPSLPRLEIVLNDLNRNTYSSDFSYVSKQQSSFRSHSRTNQNSQQKSWNDNMFPRRAEVVLHKSSSAWNSKKPQSDTDVMISKMKSILNRITPQVFDPLVEQFKELPVDSEDRLDGCISLLFDQSVLQPIYSSLYAKMAKILSNLAVPSNADKTKVVKFRSLLLMKCQAEFEQEKVTEKIVFDINQKIAEAHSETEKKQLAETKEESITKAKRRYLGTLVFIGELYKLDMLTEGIMHECLKKLLSGYEDEDKIECFCKLLTTIGSKIDDPKSKIGVNGYFNEMMDIIKEKKVCTRIRFMMMDLADLRKSKWVARRKVEGPKTIDEIHKEAGSVKKVTNTTNNVMPRKEAQDTTRYPWTAPAQKQSSQVKQIETEDWTNVSKSSYKASKPDIQNSKMIISKMDENTKLGPSRNNWSKGSTFGNRFSAFSNISEMEEPKAPVMEIPKEEPKVPVKVTPKQEPLVIPAPVLKKDNKELEISKNDMEKKVKSRVEEYLSIRDMKEALMSVEELNTKTCFKNALSFFYISLEQNIEKTSKVREQVGHLHLNILKSGIASVEAYAEALRKLSRFADDLVVDIPQIWKYLGEIVSPVFLEDSDLKLDILLPAENGDNSDDEFESAEDDNTARLVAVILNEVGDKKGMEFATQLWDKSGLNWENLVKNRSVKDFLEKFLK